MRSSPLGPGLIVTEAPANRQPDVPEIRTTAHPKRSELLRWRLSYARAGIRTSPADAKKKKPVLRGWQDLATTDPRRIHAESNGGAPPFNAILRPTGSRDRTVVLDEDIDGELERLGRELGIPLRGTTTEIGTPSGRVHLHFRLPEGVEVDGSVGKHVKDDYIGLDVRGKGNQVLLPPSPGYSFANGLPMAEAPPGLIEWARSRKKSVAATSSTLGAVAGFEAGETVPKLSRNAAMVRFLGRKHDGSRTLGELIACGMAYREACFEDPASFPDAEVEKIARWTIGKDPCKRRRERERNPGVEKALEACSRYWYAERLPGGGRSKLRDVYRACLRSAARRSEMGEAVTVDGEVVEGPAFSDSCRQLAEVANTSFMSVSRNLNRMVELGALAKIEAPEGLAPTFVLTPPETPPRTSVTPPGQPPAPPIGERLSRGVTVARADELKVPFFGWRSPVGNSRAGAWAALEAFGPQTEEELAELLGISRPRDVRRRLLEPLAEMGAAVRDGGAWSLLEDDEQVADSLWHEPYATVSRRRARTRTDEGRMVTTVEEHVRVASDAERVEAMKERYCKEREEFAVLLKESADRAEEELRQEEEIRELLNSWDEEREALDHVEADGTIDELEPVEEVEHGSAEVSGDAGDVSVAQELPQAGRPSGLAAALAFWLEKNPGDHPERKPPDEFYMQCSWLASTMDCYELVDGGRPDPMDVARALGELARTVTEEAA